MSLNRVQNVIHNTFKVPMAEIKLQTGPENTASWDSLGHLQLVSALEEEFEIEFAMDQVEKMQNVEKILSVLKELGIESV